MKMICSFIVSFLPICVFVNAQDYDGTWIHNRDTCSKWYIYYGLDKAGINKQADYRVDKPNLLLHSFYCTEGGGVTFHPAVFRLQSCDEDLQPQNLFNESRIKFLSNYYSSD